MVIYRSFHVEGLYDLGETNTLKTLSLIYVYVLKLLVRLTFSKLCSVSLEPSVIFFDVLLACYVQQKENYNLVQDYIFC